MGKRPTGMLGKMPPAPSVGRRPVATGTDIKGQIVHEICTALERLDAEPELLSIVGSWRDTLDDAEVLSLLRQ